MKTWGLFTITLGTIAIISYPSNLKIINMYMGIFLIIMGTIMYFRGKK